MSVVVPAGSIVRYGYAQAEQFRGFEHYGAVQRDVLLEKLGRFSEANGGQYAEDAPWVRWTENGGFKVQDGRHAFLALLGAGYSVYLVRWMEEQRG